MSRFGLRQAFHEVFDDPALLLIELGWRWSFGLIAVLVFVFSALHVLGSIGVDTYRLEGLAALNPLRLGQQIAAMLAGFGAALFRAVLIAGLVLTTFWIVLSSLGRNATLACSALRTGASLRVCFAISLSRALITIVCALAWLLTTAFATFIGSRISRDALPNLAVTFGIVIVALLLIASVWSVLNWFLSLAALFAEDHWKDCVLRAGRLVRCCADELLEISIVSTLIRLALFMTALLSSLAVSAIVTSPRILVVDFVAIGLLYFLGADFLFVVRLVAYGSLRTAMPQRPLKDVVETSHELRQNLETPSLPDALQA